MATSAAFSGAEAVADREPVCYTLTSTGTQVHSGTKRHDDGLPPPGFVVFDDNGAMVDRTADGYQEVPCDSECCPEVIGEGCWDDGTNSGTWVSIRSADGNVEVIDPTTGNEVLPADVVDCPLLQFQTLIETVDENDTFSITIAGLVGWSVRAKGDAVTLTIGTGSHLMDDGEIITAATPPDNDSELLDQPQITTGAGSTARVVYQQRA